MQYMYKCCAIYVFNRVELTCQMILDKGSGFLHLLDDIATKDCFRGRALRYCCVACINQPNWPGYLNIT